MDRERFEHYRIHIEDKDIEHKKILDLSYSATRYIKAREYISAINSVSELLEFATLHFENEEKNMSSKAYPFIDHHVHKHNDLIRSLRKLSGQLPTKEKIDEIGTSHAIHSIRSFAQEYLDHIDHHDRQYADFILKK